MLTVKTGHLRNYDEGHAYHHYFADDDLMFDVRPSFRNYSLKNKAEVVGVWLPEHPKKPLAISAEFLFKNQMYFDHIEDVHFVVLTENGANAIVSGNRVFQVKSLDQFKSWDPRENKLIDTDDQVWLVSESEIAPEDKQSKEQPLKRIPSHRSFWFGKGKLKISSIF